MDGHDGYPGDTHARLDSLFRSDPYAGLLGAELLVWGQGEARLRWMPHPGHHNFIGVVHGGALFSLADAALAVASNSWGRACLALSVDAQFLAAPPAGQPLATVARERSRSRRTASYTIEVTGPDGGGLVAAFQGLVYRTDRWHLGAEAWPEDWRTAH